VKFTFELPAIVTAVLIGPEFGDRLTTKGISPPEIDTLSNVAVAADDGSTAFGRTGTEYHSTCVSVHLCRENALQMTIEEPEFLALIG
jgi:hypothetical protein